MRLSECGSDPMVKGQTTREIQSEDDWQDTEKCQTEQAVTHSVRPKMRVCKIEKTG